MVGVWIESSTENRVIKYQSRNQSRHVYKKRIDLIPELLYRQVEGLQREKTMLSVIVYK